MNIDTDKVKFVAKSKMLSMKILAFFLGKKFMTDFWTTIRWPFSKKAIIAHPDSVEDPMAPKYRRIVEHEMIHVNDMSSSWGLFKMFWLVWLLPLPFLFSGRWFIERYAYLHNILNHGYNVDWVVDTLWSGYAWPWPKSLMKKWFLKQIELYKEKVNG